MSMYSVVTIITKPQGRFAHLKKFGGIVVKLGGERLRQPAAAYYAPIVSAFKARMASTTGPRRLIQMSGDQVEVAGRSVIVAEGKLYL